MAPELKPWNAAEGRLRQEGQVEKLAYFPKRLSASQRMNYFRYGTLQLSTVEFPMYLSFVKYSSVDTFFSQDKYEKFKSQKETFQGEGERLFGFHDNICFKQILVDLFSQFHPHVALEKNWHFNTPNIFCSSPYLHLHHSLLFFVIWNIIIMHDLKSRGGVNFYHLVNQI